MYKPENSLLQQLAKGIIAIVEVEVVVDNDDDDCHKPRMIGTE